MSSIFEKRLTDSGYLANRLDFNQKYSRTDFLEWLFNHLQRLEFKSVLDAACGTGKQTYWFAERLKDKGKVCAFDISEKSVEKVQSNAKKFGNIEVALGSMDSLTDCVKSNFSIQAFDLVHCSFALYYAKNPKKTLQQMAKVLSKEGTLVISGPHQVNTLLTFLSQYQDIPQPSWDCMEFISDLVLPFCYNEFEEVRTHLFVNNLLVTDINDFGENYRSSTFYSGEAEEAVMQQVESIIRSQGYFHIQKNSKLVIARKPIKG